MKFRYLAMVAFLAASGSSFVVAAPTDAQFSATHARCYPTKSHSQALEDFNVAIDTALAEYNAEISSTQADYQAEVTCAEAEFQRAIQSPKGNPDSSSNQLNEASLIRNQALRAAAEKHNTRIATARVVYDAKVAQATEDYDRALCRQ